MNRASLLLLTTLAIVSVAHAQGASPTLPEAVKNAQSCFTRKAIQLDDGTSDAKTVARAAIKACPKEIDAWAYAGEGYKVGSQMEVRRALEDAVTDTVSGYVLQWRAIKRDLEAEVARQK